MGDSLGATVPSSPHRCPAQLRTRSSVPPGKINVEEIQRTVQKIVEQYTSTLKNTR